MNKIINRTFKQDLASFRLFCLFLSALPFFSFSFSSFPFHLFFIFHFSFFPFILDVDMTAGAFFTACAQGDHAHVETLLKKSPELILRTDEQGNNALHVALFAQPACTVQLVSSLLPYAHKLFEEGQQEGPQHWFLRIINRVGSSPLHSAAYTGDEGATKVLLDYLRLHGNQASLSAIVSQGNQNGSTPIHYAAQMGHVGVLRSLLAAAGDDLDDIINQGDHVGFTALHYAVREGKEECARECLMMRADPRRKNMLGKDSFIYARNNQQVLHLLEEWKAQHP
jgi:ankyrin repeat protein